MDNLKATLPLISIIVPIYNVEAYLRKCIDSIINQTYRNLEIVLVNDGSTDTCGDICDEYANNDERIIVIHKENGGLSSARNAGIDICTGEYIAFVDSDDFIALDYVEISIRLCLENNAEISIINTLYVDQNANEVVKISGGEKVYHFSAKEAIEGSLYQTLYSCNACGKLFQRKVFSNVRFPIGAYCEDLAVCHIIFSNAKKIIFCDSVGYYYRKRSTSILNEPFNPRHLDGLHFALMIESYCINMYPELLRATKCRTFNVAISIIVKLPKEKIVSDQYYPIIIKEIRRTRLSVLLNRKARFREKAAAILSFFGLSVLKGAWNSRFAIRN